MANEKAMRTLRIKEGSAKDVKKSIPTPANFYKELMAKAGREVLSMYEGAHKARERAAAGLAPGGDVVVVKEEIKEEARDDEIGEADELMKALISQLPVPPTRAETLDVVKEEMAVNEVNESDLAAAAASGVLGAVNKVKKKRKSAPRRRSKTDDKKKKSLREASDDEADGVVHYRIARKTTTTTTP